ncbi:hypothetical protein C0993_002956 [Termitomyces sp. T159_Od127]|nr:hypothetical protein C0993_002956 [Termitomyces sp. T159_Od127]
MRKMVTRMSTYAPTRGPSLLNAILHHKSKELNEDRIAGNHLKLKDIQEEVDKDTNLDVSSMSKQRQKELIDELIDHHMLKSQGSCSNNRAAALDAHQNIKAITLEVSLCVFDIKSVLTSNVDEEPFSLHWHLFFCILLTQSR